MTGPAPAAVLSALAKEYLAFRRRLGFEMDKPGFLVRRFAGYCDSAGITQVTDQAVLDWVLLAQPVAPSYRWLRLNAARGFAIYLHALDPTHQIPAPDLVPCRRDRPAPCIVSSEAIQTLMEAAGRRRPELHAATFQTLIGLIAATGMRTCEAVRADDGDINPAEAAMTLHGKNRRDRRIPLHPTTLDALVGYQQLRDRLIPGYAGPSLLVNTRGRRLNADQVRTHFAHLVDTAGLGALTPRPTLRALRHTFAVTTLTGWLNADAQAGLPLLQAHMGHTKPRHTFWFRQAVPELLQAASDHMLRAAAGTAGSRTAPHTAGGDSVSALAPILQGFFRVKLMQHKDASPHTISSYRDTWRLLLRYAQQTTGTPPEKMRLAQLDHELITGFLHHLDTERGNTARTRNNRLAAIHSTFRYAALRAPEDAEVIQRVLAIESARTDDTEISWLTPEETAAVLTAPDHSTWTGHRDHAMITVLLATGLRISELLNLTRADARIQATGSHVRCTGKGRRERSTPLDPASAAVLGEWVDHTSGQPADPLFPARGRTSRKLTRDGFQARLDKYQEIASRDQTSLADKHLFPHLFRHTRAMNMRIAGHDVSIIALWLGHQDVSSTMKYLHADLKLKEQALDRTAVTELQLGRYRPSDTVLDFLDSLTAPGRE